MANDFVPFCGQSDKRNEEYIEKYSPKKFFDEVGICDASPIILDIGGHKGESVKFFKNIFNDAVIYSIEPDPESFKELSALAERYGTKALNLAVSDFSGEADYYRQDISHLGGLKPIKKESRDSIGYAEKAQNEKITVPCFTLDKICSDISVDHIDILKIDVQGHEVAVLKGSEYALQITTCVMVEVSLYDFYGKNEGLLGVEKVMSRQGFELWDISKISKNPRNLRTDWIECVYRKKTSNL